MKRKEKISNQARIACISIEASQVTLESWEYGNPETVALRKEGKTCNGCKHEQFYTAFNMAVWICTAKDEKNKRRNHGKRCAMYRER